MSRCWGRGSGQWRGRGQGRLPPWGRNLGQVLQSRTGRNTQSGRIQGRSWWGDHSRSRSCYQRLTQRGTLPPWIQRCCHHRLLRGPCLLEVTRSLPSPVAETQHTFSQQRFYRNIEGFCPWVTALLPPPPPAGPVPTGGDTEPAVTGSWNTTHLPSAEMLPERDSASWDTGLLPPTPPPGPVLLGVDVTLASYF